MFLIYRKTVKQVVPHVTDKTSVKQAQRVADFDTRHNTKKSVKTVFPHVTDLIHMTTPRSELSQLFHM